MTGTFYTWDSLGTFAGATAATLLIVQYLKLPLDRWRHVPTRIVALVVSLLIQISVALMRGWAWKDVPLLVVNAFFVALSAMGAYESTFAGMDKEE